MFEIEFNGCRFTMNKNDVEFKFGYGVFKKILNKNECRQVGCWHNDSLTIMGVINENYETVFDCTWHYKDIQFFPEGNFIAKALIQGGDGEQSYIKEEHRHFKVINNKCEKIAVIPWVYNIIDNNNVKVRGFKNNEVYEEIYDVINNKYVSEKFTHIEEFELSKELNNQLIAKAFKTVRHEDSISKLICYINSNGEILSNLYNTVDDSIIDTKDSNFSFDDAIEHTKLKLKEISQEKDAKVKFLKKTINNYY